MKNSEPTASNQEATADCKIHEEKHFHRLRLDPHRSDERLFVWNDRDDYMTLIGLQYCTGCDLLIIHHRPWFYKIILALRRPFITMGVRNKQTHNDCVFTQQLIWPDVAGLFLITAQLPNAIFWSHKVSECFIVYFTKWGEVPLGNYKSPTDTSID